VTDVIRQIADEPAYFALMTFLGLYPVVTGLYWIVGSIHFWFHRERRVDGFYELDQFPFVSVIVAARNEEAVIGETVETLLDLDWPNFEIVIVDDGSTDRTSEILARYADVNRIRLVTKRVNEGKAMAIDDAWPLLRGEIVLLVDADGRPRRDVLRFMVPHFVKVPRVAAVTGNPRAANTTTLLAKLQAIEFTATVSMLRRAQATWGRLMTFSGICTALRKSAVEPLGRFSPTMATEDIALAWELQVTFSDVRYEPQALFGMQVPETLAGWWSQRTRWSKGLSQVMRRHSGILLSWKKRRMWPVYIEAGLSTFWAHCMVVSLIFWAAAFSVGVYGFGGNPIPNYWGLLIATVLCVQVLCGLWLDGRYDPTVRRYALWLPLYPLVYWMMVTFVTVRATIPGLLAGENKPVTWTPDRIRDEPPPPLTPPGSAQLSRS
jgi:biofilm PGA synthesis N-glycosyltransferase PgaC